MMPHTKPALLVNPVQAQTTGNYFFHNIPLLIPAIPIASVNTVHMPVQSTSCIEEVTEELEALDDQIHVLSMMASDSSKHLKEIEASIFKLDKKKNNFTRH